MSAGNASDHSALLKRLQDVLSCAPLANDLISWPTKHCVPQRAGHIADALAEAAGVADDAIDVIAEYDSMRKALIAEYNLNTEAGRVLLPNGRHLVDDIRRFIEGGGKVEPK